MIEVGEGGADWTVEETDTMTQQRENPSHSRGANREDIFSQLEEIAVRSRLAHWLCAMTSRKEGALVVDDGDGVGWSAVSDTTIY